MKLGIRPFPYPFHKTMFNGIVMDVIHMGLEVPFVPNRVFPKTPLPHVVFTFLVLSDCRIAIR